MIEKGKGICFGAFTIWVSTAFSVVPDGFCVSEISDRIDENYACSSATREEPDRTIRVEETELEACPGSFIEGIDVVFTLGSFDPEWMDKFNSLPSFFLSPFLTRIERSYHIETDSFPALIKGKWVYLE